MKYLVDTSVYVSIYATRDSLHPQTIQCAPIIEQEVVIVPTIVIAEVIHTLSIHQPNNVASAFHHLIQEEVVNLDQNFLKKFSRYSYPSAHLKTSDLIIAVTASIYKATLVTWDKGMLTYAGSLCEVTSPKTLLSQSIKT